MLNLEDIIREAESLPVNDRVLLIDALLRSMYQSDSENDRKWAEVAKCRLEELRSGVVQAVPGDIVFEKLIKRLTE